MRNIALLTEFDGSAFHGWQSQKGHRNVQDVLAKAIYECFGENVKLIGCSRTDAGVHALGHVSNFTLDNPIPVNRIPAALNTHLPADCVVREAALAPLEFNARFDSCGKQYRYRLYMSPTRTALDRKRVCHIKQQPDLDKMKEAAGHIIGTHDFRAFMASGSSVSTTIRTIRSIDFVHKDNYLDIIVYGDAFLFNMVRIIAGTLYYAGLNKISANDVPDIIKAGDRRKAGKTLPSHALYLEKVFYKACLFD